eukprot:jgi/Mesen1/5378/ME000268S04569
MRSECAPSGTSWQERAAACQGGGTQSFGVVLLCKGQGLGPEVARDVLLLVGSGRRWRAQLAVSPRLSLLRRAWSSPACHSFAHLWAGVARRQWVPPGGDSPRGAVTPGGKGRKLNVAFEETSCSAVHVHELSPGVAERESRSPGGVQRHKISAKDIGVSATGEQATHALACQHESARFLMSCVCRPYPEDGDSRWVRQLKNQSKRRRVIDVRRQTLECSEHVLIYALLM